MEKAGGRSWRFSHGVAHLPNVALYVRDALALEVPAWPMIPPRLIQMPDATTQGAVEDGKGDAGRQWASWWQALLRNEIANETASSVRTAGSRQVRSERLQSTWDPPEWASLANRPALRAGVRATYPDGERWVSAARSVWQSNERHLFPWETTLELAERISSDLIVPIDQVRGQVIVLLVNGLWWEQFAPGVVLCSSAAAHDPDVSRRIVEHAFGSAFAA